MPRRPVILALALLLQPSPAGEDAVLAPPELRPGDILLRKGRSLWSRLVLSSSPAGAFSHAGILVMSGGRLQVVDSEPAAAGGGTGGVKLVLLEDFASPKEAEAVAVLRVPPHLETAAAAAAGAALRFLGRPFDAALDLGSEDSLYCTELVWRAYLAAGVNLLTDPPGTVRLGPFRGEVILPGDLERSRLLRTVWISARPMKGAMPRQ